MKKVWFLLPAAILALAILLMLWPAGEDPEPKKQKVSGAMRALDFWAAQRAYPNKVVPDVGFAAAWEQARSMDRGDNAIDDSVAPWNLLGPTNIGGRTLCLALHPNDPDVIFAGSASGGLWKSTSGGMGADAWDYVETGFPVLGVSTIAIDPSAPDLMYIGTGEVYRYQDSIGGEAIRTTRGSYGIGILKTTDGGATWEKSLDWTYQQTRGVWMIALDPVDTDRVFAATTEGVYRSDDAGASWDLVLDVIMGTDLRIHPTNPDIVFAACGNFTSTGHGIYRSLDGGDSWTQLTSGLPAIWSGKTQLAIAPTAPDRVYASIANTGAGLGLYRSLDGGDSWTQVSSTNYAQYQGWYSHYVLISPFDADDLYVGGIEIWRSTNGGVNLSVRSDWTEIYYGTPPPEGPNGGAHYAHADHHFAVWHPSDPSIVFFASDGGVFRTTDGGDTFRCLIGGYATTQFYNGFANSATDPNRAIGGMQDNLTAIYDGTNAWRRVIGGDGAWCAVNPVDDDTMYGSWQYLAVNRSRNGGVNWSYVAPPDQGGDQTAFIAPYVLCPSDPEVLYAGRSRIYKSTNEGSNWTATNGGAEVDPAGNPMISMAVSATSPDTVYAGSAPVNARARVFRTTNGGGSWSDITGTLPDRYPIDLAVDPSDSRVVYVAFMGYGNSHVFRSADSGQTWQDIGAGLPDVPVSAVEVDPDYPQVLYAGTDLGVFISPDAGAYWYAFQDGMPTAMVNDLKVAPGRMLRAATHGNGVFERGLFDPTTTSVAELPGVAERAGLGVWPNPVQAGSRVSFELPRATDARLTLYDVRGRKVKTLLDGQAAAGPHELALDTERLPAGVYFLRLETREGARNARVVYLR